MIDRSQEKATTKDANLKSCEFLYPIVVKFFSASNSDYENFVPKKEWLIVNSSNHANQAMHLKTDPESTQM